MRLSLFWQGALLLCFNSPVLAHVGEGGIVDSYGGLIHPFTEPVHIINIIALGFLLTQQASRIHPLGWMSFALAALVGLILSVMFPAMDISLALLISAIVLGVLVACRFSLSLEVSLCISGVTGCLLGMDSLTPDPEWWSTAISIFSSTTGLGIALLIAMGWGDHLRKPWQQVGIRVVGSWIATAALLVLTLNLKPV